MAKPTMLDLIKDIDIMMVDTHQKYRSAHFKLNTYKGKTLDKEQIKQVNNILAEIQNNYEAMHPLFMYITSRHNAVVSMMHEYEQFIASLKENGAENLNLDEANGAVDDKS